MPKIKFMGSAGMVTGSNFLITSENENKILIDFGMFQGTTDKEELNYDKLGFDPAGIKGVFLTHAHLDHCGRLPLLIKGGYKGKIYMTPPTMAIVEIILNDAAGIQAEDVKHIPLYNLDDVYKTIQAIETVEYGKEVVIENFIVNFKDAGHILGASSIIVKDTLSKKTFVFSGDLGNTPQDIVRPTELIDSADVVVMETTYGSRAHPNDEPSLILQEEINKIEKRGGVLLIPAFSVERTQEILHRINHLKSENKIRSDTPVFLDSPMGIRTTTVFRQYKDYYNDELISHSDDPFRFEGLVITEDSRDSREILKANEPKVIIAGSGMMSGGRILYHALNYIDRSDTTVLFVGYQAEGTLGRKILGGARKARIKEKNINIKASTREIKSLSSHADQGKLLNWILHIKGVQKVFLVHGEDVERNDFANILKSKSKLEIYMPKINEEFEV